MDKRTVSVIRKIIREELQDSRLVESQKASKAEYDAVDAQFSTLLNSLEKMGFSYLADDVGAAYDQFQEFAKRASRSRLM